MIRVKLDESAFMPEKAHDTDAGFDLKTPREITVRRWGETIDTGVHVEIPKGYVGMIKSKSGLNVKHGLVCEGVIDAGYTGSIVVKMYNNDGLIHKFEAGDKIAQLVIIPIHPCNEMQLVDELEETERGDNGFGSTGR